MQPLWNEKAAKQLQRSKNSYIKTARTAGHWQGALHLTSGQLSDFQLVSSYRLRTLIRLWRTAVTGDNNTTDPGLSMTPQYLYVCTVCSNFPQRQNDFPGQHCVVSGHVLLLEQSGASRGSSWRFWICPLPRQDVILTLFSLYSTWWQNG